MIKQLKQIGMLAGLFFTFISFSVSAQGNAVNANSVVEKLKKKYEASNKISLSFDLTIFWSVRERYEKKSGELIFFPKEKFKLTMGSTTWVSNGQTYWQYSSKTNQVVIKSLLDIDLSLHPSTMIQSFLSYIFKVHTSDEKNMILMWEGEAKNSNLPYKKVIVNIDRKKMEINELTVTDDNDNESRYTFKKIKFNTQVPASTFEFEIPEGADVLDTRK